MKDKEKIKEKVLKNLGINKYRVLSSEEDIIEETISETSKQFEKKIKELETQIDRDDHSILSLQEDLEWQRRYNNGLRDEVDDLQKENQELLEKIEQLKQQLKEHKEILKQIKEGSFIPEIYIDDLNELSRVRMLRKRIEDRIEKLSLDRNPFGRDFRVKLIKELEALLQGKDSTNRVEEVLV